MRWVTLPTVTFLGPFPFRALPDMKRVKALRGVPVEVSKDWLAKNMHLLMPRYWRVEGYEQTVDEGNDGIPDEGWTKKDISAWLKGKGSEVSGYMTKTKMLGMVGNVLNPKAAEENELGEEPTQQNGDE